MLCRWRKPEPGSPARSALDRVRQDRGLGVLTAAAMVVFVVVVYVIVVIGGGALARPHVAQPVAVRAGHRDRGHRVRPGPPRVQAASPARCTRTDCSPYQVLAQFPRQCHRLLPGEELPARMARCWPRAPERPAPRCGWPCTGGWNWRRAGRRHHDRTATPRRAHPAQPERPAASTVPPSIPNRRAHAKTRPDRGRPTIVVDGARHSLAVRERGELLGALTVVLRDGQQLAPVEERLFAGLAAQSGLMLRVAGLRTELEQQLARPGAAQRTNCARPAGIWSPGRTPSGSDWNATSMTAPNRN